MRGKKPVSGAKGEYQILVLGPSPAGELAADKPAVAAPVSVAAPSLSRENPKMVVATPPGQVDVGTVSKELMRDAVTHYPSWPAGDVAAADVLRGLQADVAGLQAEMRELRELQRQWPALLAVDVSDLRTRIAVLEAVDAERRRRKLHPGDPAFLVRLWPAISGCFGAGECLVCDVLADPVLATLVDGRNAQALGKLFDRACNVPIGRYVLRDCGRTPDHVRRYRVEGV